MAVAHVLLPVSYLPPMNPEQVSRTKKMDSEVGFERQSGFGGRTSPNSSIRRHPGQQLLESVANFSLRIDDYGSTPVRNHSGSEVACEKPVLRGEMFILEAAAGLSTGTLRQAN